MSRKFDLPMTMPDRVTPLRMTPDEKRQLIDEMARYMQRDRGMKRWDDLGPAAQRSWVKRAEHMAWNVPSLRRLLWGQS